jgi:hypothetical protein
VNHVVTMTEKAANAPWTWSSKVPLLVNGFSDEAQQFGR